MPEFGLLRSLGVASVAGGRVKARSLVRDGRFEASLFARRRLPYCHTSPQSGYPVTCGLSLQAPMPMVNARCKSRLRRDFATQQRRNFSENFSDDGEGCARTAHNSAISRLKEPEALHEPCPSKLEGAGNAGCTLHPRSRVQWCARSGAHEHTGTVGTLRHSLRKGK